MENLTVLVIYCGFSSEHKVSERTGTAVINALRKKNVNVIPFVLTRDNVAEIAALKYDIAFIALHGRYGEDGTVQGFLELLGRKYCGSGVMSSSLCINKYFTKLLFLQNGIRTPDFKIYKDKNAIDLNSIKAPVVVKPVDEGSSIGLTIVKEQSKLKQAIDLAFEYDKTVMIEQFISGRELTVAVIEKNGELQVLPIIEIHTNLEFFSYDSKYTKGGYEFEVPAKLPGDLTQQVEEMVKKSFRALYCKDFARMDFIIDENTNKPYILEINTIPGMTETSLLPKAAAAANIPFEDLIYGFVKNNV